MSASGALLRKELLEIRRTWRIWVVPGLILFFGALGPVMAELTPALVESFASDQPGTVIQLPDPSWVDAYRQYASSLSQIVLIALLITSAELIAGERRSGTAVLVLTKPISRAAFVLIKAAAQLGLTAVALVAGTVVCWAGTRLIFGEAPVRELVLGAAVWLVFAALAIAGAVALSIVIPSQSAAGAAGAGIGLYALLALLGQWAPARDWSPAGLFQAIDEAMAHGTLSGAGPVVTGIGLTALMLWLACWRFGGVELSGGAA